SRVEKQIGSTYNYYIRGKDGNTDVVVLDPDGNGEVFNTIANGNKIGQVVWDNNSYSMIHYYYLEDHLGDVRMIIDQNGNPQAWNDYYPFGETMPGRSQFNSGPDTRYQFTSKELDAETGLYHLGARSYDPWSGRFEETDPLSDFYPDQSPYSYSFDNPILFEDASGDTVTTNWQYGLDNTINFFVTTPVNGTRSDRQGGPWDLLPSEYAGTKTYEWTESISSVEQDLPALSLMDNLRADGSGWMTLQHQAALEARAETKAFYGSIFQATATGADMVSEASNYAILFAAPLGPEAVGGAVGVGDFADWVSLGAKGLGSGLIYGKWRPFTNQAEKAAINTLTLRTIAAAEADAQLAKNPILKAEITTALNAIIP
ncbi:MAG: RHS repeat-associated core domain-containing protein, partial [Nitrososphaerota archaeon]|nr:RHS repeat-associated core domain-containing protein [Nitrososphaerota archaeon]